jgi:GWxTD domain-containing protein
MADPRSPLRRILAGALFALLLAAEGRAQDPSIAELTDLFAKAKAQFRGGGYAESLATLERLDAALRAPGLETAREKTAPAIAFYRGANLAVLGRKAEAEKELAIYLSAAPTTRLDPSMYPKTVLEAFDAARAEVHAPASGSPSAAPVGLAEAYAAFRAAPEAAAPPDETWAEGAVRFLMTKEEKAEWSRLTDATARAEFVATFWQRRDRTPETRDNEYREEIERRIEFSDVQFAQGEKKGSLTDRGMVFVLMGPPSYVASRLLRIEEDPIQAARSAPRAQVITGPTGRVAELVVTPQPMTAEKIQGSREVWHYRRDRLPASVASNEVLFEFLTKDGYGTGVLQREAVALTTLEIAAGAGAPAGAAQTR